METQLRMFMGEVAQLQAEAERNMSLLRQVREGVLGPGEWAHGASVSGPWP